MTNTIKAPVIIQGGMGVGLSSVELARTVAKRGQLGVVSGTALAVSFLKRLQETHTAKPMLEALESFPYKEVANQIIDKYHTKKEELKHSWKRIWMPSLNNKELNIITVLANYVEVKMAKTGHNGLIGINYLEKIQIPTLASIYGALLAGIDYIIMGAGIPVKIPGIIEKLSNHHKVELPIHVSNAAEDKMLEFDPTEIILGEALPTLEIPTFLAIVSSATLAQHLLRSTEKHPDGFIVETKTAGGHNAGPRGKMKLSDKGEPIYGIKDEIDFVKIKALGKPFWIGGGYSSKEKLQEAFELGATGVQIGTAFAYADESGMDPELKQSMIQKIINDEVSVFTDPYASPTGFPFKTIKQDFSDRPRICDIGYLREPYITESGAIGYRCAAEPVEDYVRKGGSEEDTKNRLCLCNGLLATIGLGEERDYGVEPAIITSGDDLITIKRYVTKNKTSYSANDVIDYLLG